ncbi:hypothetical protein RBI14_04020 [Alcaligenaceae bacterium B3P038]|nr:hypothetical protein [Alcaligenaceae bacterium B3P038]
MSTTAASSNSCPTPSKRSSGWLRVVVVVATVIGLYAVDGPSKKGQVSASDAVTNPEKPMTDTAKVSGLGSNGASGLGVSGVVGLSGSGARK